MCSWTSNKNDSGGNSSKMKLIDKILENIADMSGRGCRSRDAPRIAEKESPEHD